MNPLVPSIFWVVLSMLMAIPLLVWRNRLSARQERTGYLARWLLIPYLGLITGTLSPRLMGLTALDWVAGLQNGVGLLLAVLVLLLLVRTTMAASAAALVEDVPLAESTAPPLQPAQWLHNSRTLIVAGAEEFHWCFLRAATQEAALLLVPGEQATVYGAIWIAALIGAPEALLRVDKTPRRLVQLVALVATTVLFFFTRNFWLCWMLHAMLLVLLQG